MGKFHLSVFRITGRSLLASLLAVQTAPVRADDLLPSGGTVTAGSASIGAGEGGNLAINQTSGRAIIDWNSFSIGAGKAVWFNQPDSKSAVLNRVTGSTTSSIAGSLSANGQIFLINPNGVFLSPTGEVRANSFVGSTLDITDRDFLAGDYRFRGDGSSAPVVNEGGIYGGTGGFAALVGGSVQNSGTISVPYGKIGLGAGEQVVLDPEGDGFLQVALPTGDGTDTVAIDQSGTLEAEGGRIEIKAATARNAARNIVNLSGSISAKSVSGRNGAIVFGAGPQGTVNIRQASIKARGEGAKGGNLTVTGKAVAIDNATLDASGDLGGGMILIGGNGHGGGILPLADTVVVDAASALRADSLISGNAGDIELWSRLKTTISGAISAQAFGTGDGGFIETSSLGELRFGTEGAHILAGARQGKAGTWLIDPQDLVIDATGATNIVTALNGGTNVTATTTSCSASYGTCSGSLGDLTVSSAITWTGSGQLRLTADNNLSVNAAISASNAASAIRLDAGGTGGISSSAAGTISTAGLLTLNATNAAGVGTMDGVVSGAGGLTKSGAGTVKLSASNSYTGATTVSGGTLQISGSGRLGGGTYAGAIALASGTKLQYSSDANQTITGTISGAGSITKDTSSTSQLSLNATNSFTGGLNLNAGTLASVDVDGLGAAGSSVAIGAGTQMNLTTAGITTYDHTWSGSGTLNLSSTYQLHTWGDGSAFTGAINAVGAQKHFFNGDFSKATLNTSAVSTSGIETGRTFKIGGLTGTGVVRSGGASNGTATLEIGGTNTSSTFDGTLTQFGGLQYLDVIKTGTGTFTLTNAGTYAGLTQVNGGTFKVGNGTTGGLSASSTVSVGSAGTLSLNLASGSTFTNAVANAGKVEFSQSGTLTQSGLISGAGGVTQSGSGTTTLSASNTYSGATSVNAGTLKAGNGTAFGTNSAVNVASGATLDLAGKDSSIGSLAGAGTVTNSGASATVTTGGDNSSASFSGVIRDGTGTVSLVKAGSGTQSLSGVNTYSGTTTINAGRLELTGAGKLGNGTYAAALTTASGATFRSSTSADQTYSNLAAGAGTNTFDGSGTVTINGDQAFTGIANLNQTTMITGGTNNNIAGLGNASTVNVGGLVTLGGTDNSFLGISSNATLNINSGGTLYNPGTYSFHIPTLNLNGGTISSAATLGTSAAAWGTYNFDKLVTVNANSTISSIGNVMTQTGGTRFDVANGVDLTVSGTLDSVTLSNDRGLIKQGSGRLILSGNSSYTASTTVSAGTLQVGNGTSGDISASSPISVANGATLALNKQGGSIFANQVANSGTVQFMQSGTLEAQGAISGTGNLLQSGTGTTVLMGGNTYSGTTDISAGRLDVGWGRNTGLLGSGAVTNNGVLVFNHYDAMSIANMISGTGSLVQQGAGALTLTGTNTYTGGTTISSSSLIIGGNGSLGSGAYAGPINLAASGVNFVHASSTDQTITGAITGAGRVMKTTSGTSTLTLAGANTYSGSTTVAAGTLDLSGSLNVGSNTTSASVNAGATLKGSGVITASGITFGNPGTVDLTGNNQVGSIAGSGTLGSLTFRNAKSLAVGSLSASSINLQAAGATSDLTLSIGAALSASGTGTSVILSAGRNFINNAGAAAIALSGTGSPNWQIYSAAPGGDTFNNLDSGNTAVWGKTYGQSVSQTGNRYIFANSPTLTFSSANQSKFYGNDATAAVANAYTVSGHQAGISGAYLTDTNASAFSGAPTVTSSGSAASASVSGGPYAISLSAGTLSALNGYTLVYSSPGQLTVAPRPITVTADGKSRYYGSANPALTYTIGGLGLANGDTLSGSLTTTAGLSSSVGNYAITQGSLAAGANYDFTYNSALLSITPRPITVTVDGKSRYYGSANPALTYTIGGLGLANGDTLSGALATSATQSSLIGRYAITQGSLVAPAYYDVSFTGSVLDVLPIEQPARDRYIIDRFEHFFGPEGLHQQASMDNSLFIDGSLWPDLMELEQN